MLGSLNKDDDEKRIKNRINNTQQALEKIDPTKTVRVNSDGYTFEGSAGDGSKFFAPTGKGDPVAEKARALPQQWQARQPQARVNTRSSQPSITSPKTMGDVFRYNREMKVQELRNAQANTEAKTGIDAFEASQNAKYRDRSANTADSQLRLTADQNQATNALSADKNNILRGHYDNTHKTNAAEVGEKIRYSKAKSALEASLSPSEISLRESQAELARQQGLTSAQAQDAQRMENDHRQRIITARNRYEANPTPENRNRVQALESDLSSGQMTPYQQATLDQKESAEKIKFLSTFPLNRQEEALKQYERYKQKFGGDPTKMAALIAGQEDAEEEDYATQLFNNFKEN